MAAAREKCEDLPCEDFFQLQEELKKLRTFDDRIVHNLNSSIPTKSLAQNTNFTSTCKDFYEQITQAFDTRHEGINKCIKKTQTSVNELRAKREKDMDNLDTLKNLRNEQTKLRQLQKEVNIDEIVRDQTLKVWYERCRNYYKPPDV